MVSTQYGVLQGGWRLGLVLHLNLGLLNKTTTSDSMETSFGIVYTCTYYRGFTILKQLYYICKYLHILHILHIIATSNDM